ncbi:hypothetical protein B0H13DRAFT_1865817 [Mycena leptocephala]|nr:hypothetical protein B0H13DRAFT_1865817 [Mycena leptocephala]
MPLAINLIAHLVDVEGCSSVLTRWEAERTSMISDGYDKKFNLDVSILLSLSSPRIKAVPQAQELLSLLSMLPDGLSDVELLQSKLLIEDIRNCRTTLIRTALAYLDDAKQLKVLVPIREYVQKAYPSRNELVKPLFKYFHELLEVYKDFYGTEMSSATVGQISSNLGNIQSLLRNGLQKDCPDLTGSVLYALYLNGFSRIAGRGPETLITQALEHFEHFEDPDLKCRPTVYTLYMKTDFSGFKVGDCFAARLHACEAQRLAGISADLYTEATALTVEAMAWTQLGNYKHSISLYTRARDLLVLCDRDIMVELAEIHLVKSEYREAHNIRTQILPECRLHWDSYHHAFALMSIAEIVSPIMGRKRSKRQPSAPRKRREKKGKKRAVPSSNGSTGCIVGAVGVVDSWSILHSILQTILEIDFGQNRGRIELRLLYQNLKRIARKNRQPGRIGKLGRKILTQIDPESTTLTVPSTIEQASLTTPDPKSRESSPKDLSSRSPSLSDEDLPEVPDCDTQPRSGMSREDLIYGVPVHGQNRDWDYFMDNLNYMSESEEEVVVDTDSSMEEEVTLETEESSVFVETDVE